MFAAGKTAGASSGSTIDAQFNYVTMLLHGDGTNGAQNNTFLDSSTNNFTITRNGNTTQGSFSPYGSNWSNAFTASSGSYLSVPYSSAFNLTGDFTVECWINPSQLPTAFQTGSPLYSRIFSFGTYNAVNSIGLEINSNDTGRVNCFSVWYNTGQYYSANNIVAVGTWYHCAMVRSGTVITLYLNGTSVLTITGASAAVNTSQALYIASLQSYENDANACFKGYISNLRVVKGTAVYTTSFTPPTTPLTAITNTTLLTCQSNRFVDNSTTAATITSFGTPSVQRFNPFGTATAYSTSVIGGSGYFDGSGDYLNAGSNSAFAVGTGDFTFQAWIYPTSFQSPVSAIFETGSGVVSTRFSVVIYSNGQVKIDNNTNLLTSSTALILNQWTFISVIRSSGTMTMYFNGTSVASGSITTNFSETQGVIGKTVDNYYYPGYITDLRLVKGTALSNTVPTAPLTNVTNTSLLTNYTNGAIFDNAMINDLETQGNAQISTSVYKYGTGSLYFDGNGDRLNIATKPPLNITGDFTIEMWVYMLSLPSYSILLDISATGTAGSGMTEIWIESNGAVAYYARGTTLMTTASSVITTNAWYHIAVVKSGTSQVLYVSGTNQASATSSTQPNFDLPYWIGDRPAGAGSSNYPVYGYIDDFRITNGYARYTANFTPPTAAFPNTGPV